MRFIVSFFILLNCASCFSAPCIHYLECADGMEDCHALADESCPHGYSTLNENAMGSGFGTFAAARSAGSGTPHMVVTCK